MEKENRETGNEQQTDSGHVTGIDSAAGDDSGRDNQPNGCDDPNSAVAGISRQARRKTESETGNSAGGPAETGRTRRTRASGGTTGTKSRAKKSAQGKLDLNSEARTALARQVAGIHKLVGIAVGQSQLVAISDEQAENLTNAALDVMQHYDMNVSPVVAAWANLAAVCATIYAPKFLMFNAMRKQARQQYRHASQAEVNAQSQTQSEQNVFDFSAGGGV